MAIKNVQLELFEADNDDNDHPDDELDIIEATPCTLGEYLERCNIEPKPEDDLSTQGYLVVLEQYEEDGKTMAVVGWATASSFEEEYEKISETIH